MGISLDQEWTLITQPVPQALASGVSQVGFQIRETFLMPVRLISQEIKASDVRFVSIVGMAQINDAVVETAVQVQSFFPILQFTGMITVALALTNLLPLPALDGGRILFVLIEAIRGRRVDPMREGYVHIAGMLLLLTLMAFMVLNDILNPVLSR
jgi:regulator of sigma E protease